ncbi:MAG: hypothetical protein R2844_05020 [Caldilineales bacterium]
MSTSMRIGQSSRVRWAGIALLALALALYLLTLDNGLRPGELAGGDLVTHQYAQVQGRPSKRPATPFTRWAAGFGSMVCGQFWARRQTRRRSFPATRRCGRCWPSGSSTG